MLILTRRIGETLIIGDDVNITVLGVKGNQVRLGINAPKDVSVHREEIYLRIQQEKEGTEIVGYNFIINVEKSRYVKEKSKIPVSVSYEGGISRWSGLLDIALESGHVVKPSNGWYSRMDADGEIEDKKFRIKDTDTADFWIPILKQKSFTEFVKNKYQVSAGEIMKTDQYDIELEDVDDEE